MTAREAGRAWAETRPARLHANRFGEMPSGCAWKEADRLGMDRSPATLREIQEGAAERWRELQQAKD